MKSRILFCSFWEDPYMHSASLETKLLGVYYWTSPQANLIGLYCLASEYAPIETGICKTEIEKAKDELEKLKYVHFYKNWVYLPNAQQICGYVNEKKQGVAAQKELSIIPSEVLEHFRSLGYTIPYPYSTNSPRNKKSETKNQEQEKKTEQGMMTRKETDQLLKDIESIGL